MFPYHDMLRIDGETKFVEGIRKHLVEAACRMREAIKVLAANDEVLVVGVPGAE
jgi:hypothetical protein